jgi:Kelch motif/Galactose oxidase, central domain
MKCVLALGLAAFMCGCQLAVGPVGSWAVAAAPPTAISTNSMVALPDGRLVLFGGFDLRSGRPVDSTQVFDTAGNQWTVGAPMPGPLQPDVVVALRDGMVLVAGGVTFDPSGFSKPLGDTWLYDAGRNSWSKAGSMLTPRNGSGAVLLTDGRVLMAGGALQVSQPDGTFSGKNVAGAEIFDPQTRKWSAAGNMNVPRDGAALVALPHGSAVAAGGCAFNGGISDAGNRFAVPLSDVELFDAASRTWSITTSLSQTRCGAAGVLLSDGRVFVSGGGSGVVGNRGLTTLRSAVIFDPDSRHWTPAGTTIATRSSPVVLADGRVMIPDAEAGRSNGDTFTVLVGGQIYDPRSGDWNYVTTTSIAVSSRFFDQVGFGSALGAALPNGQAVVLVVVATLTFQPDTAPADAQPLDSPSLSMLLAVLALVLALFLGVLYLRGKRPG